MTLIAAGGLSAAQATANVSLRLRAFQDGPVLKAGSEIVVELGIADKYGACFQQSSAIVATNEATKDTLTLRGGAEAVGCEEGSGISGFISQLELATTGKLTAKGTKLVLSQSHCSAIPCKFKYNCVYKLPAGSGTISIPGGLEQIPFTFKGKLDKKKSGSECATVEDFGGQIEEASEPGRYREPVWAEDTT